MYSRFTGLMLANKVHLHCAHDTCHMARVTQWGAILSLPCHEQDNTHFMHTNSVPNDLYV